MNYGQWAEQLLMGRDLKDKLSSPSELVDSMKTKWKHSPSRPGRPSSIPISNGPRSPFPKLHSASGEKQVGDALLFFANHELLAIELMALCLLKFPDAPPQFRNEIRYIIAEEQQHLRMYLKRAGELGSVLGDVPMNGFFWNALSNMKTPMEFVTAMGLTLEQANLDHCIRFMGIFKEMKDHKTHSILQKVYRDEIGHVSHAVRWHTHWNTHSAPTIESHSFHLTRPMTPARAKGKAFDECGRIQAGLTTEYIQDIRIYAHSKGRPPNLYWFNANAEQCMHQGKIPKMAKKLQTDLTLLPLFTAKEDDIVLVERPIPNDHLLMLKRQGISLPQIHPIQKIGTLKNRKVGDLIPWSASPEIKDVFKEFGGTWKENDRNRFRKSWATSKLQSFLNSENATWLSATSTVGQKATSLQQLIELTDNFISAGYSDLIMKGDLSAAGRDRAHFRGNWEGNQKKWVQNTINNHKAIVVEPFLNKIADLSVQIHVQADGKIQTKGVTRFFTNKSGQWHGHFVGPYQKSLTSKINRFISDNGQNPRRFSRLLYRLAEFVGMELHRSGHIGPAGIDSMIHLVDGQLKFRPIVEINPRMTMGTIALALQKRVAATGVFWIAYNADESLFDNAPPQFVDGKLTDGIMPLTPKNATFTAVLGAGKEILKQWEIQQGQHTP